MKIKQTNSNEYVLPVVGTLFPLMLLIVLSIASRGLYAGELSHAEKYCDSSTEDSYCVFTSHYSGIIESTDIDKFKAMFKTTEHHISHLYQNTYSEIFLDSEGGDVESALKIGKLIRAHQGQTFVSGECYSSCVIILAGGVVRGAAIELAGYILPNGSKVGIHRPYTIAEGTYEEHRHEFHELENQIKQFFREGGVSEKLWDDMVMMPPESLKLLSQQEAIDYGLAGEDPAYADFVDGKKAKQYGIPRDTYLERKRMVKEECDSNKQILSDTTGKELERCKQNILHGRTP